VAAVPASPRLETARRLDPWQLGALAITAIGLVTALVLTVRHGLVFGFVDATSHVMIPRRVFDNAEPGLAQLGTHWGPLFHVLQLPFVWFWPFYVTGASGIIVSALASLISVSYLYRLAVLVSGSRRSAFVAAVALGTSPSFLYAGVIPMLSATIMAAATANVFYLARWVVTGTGTSLLLAGVSLSAATLAHFDTWVLAPMEAIVVLAVAQRRWRSPVRTEATMVLWGLAGGFGVFLFLLMNVIIFGDPLAFVEPFAGTGDVLEAGHRGSSALLDYPKAAVITAGPLLTAGAICGIALLASRTGDRPHRLVALLLCYPLAWYTFQAVTAGSIIFPADDLGDWRNLRYGITILPAAALFLAVGFRRLLPLALALTAAGLSTALMVTNDRVAAWEDAANDAPASGELERAAHRIPGSGRVFMPVHHFFADRFEVYSRRPSRTFVDANDTHMWRAARRAGARPGRGLAELHIDSIVWIGEETSAYRGETYVRRLARNAGAVSCFRQSERGAELIRIKLYSLDGDCAGHRAEHSSG
jgi:hypothetical protein